MSGTRKKLFDLRYPDMEERPVWMDELGAQIQLVGALYSGNGINLLIFTPESGSQSANGEPVSPIYPTVEEWNEMLKATDNPHYYETESDGRIVKAIHRKLERTVQQAQSWTIYRRDQFKCMFCEREFGIDNVAASIDHFIPVESGGMDTPDNLLSACKRCNKNKGNRDPQEFCASIRPGLFLELVAYLEDVNR